MRLWPGVERLAASPVGALALLGASRAGLGPAVMPLTLGQVYGPAASGPGLPRVGGLYGGYNGTVPPDRDEDRIYRFNNPNKTSFPSADSDLPHRLRNWFGPLTYTQFLMDHGRDLRPDDAQLTELSYDSGNCRTHSETVAGRTFQFPPREQPMHATRRSLIASLDLVEDRNGVIPSAAHRDRVALVTFDTADGAVIREGLTTDYRGVMTQSTTLQSVGDKGTTTATESGLALAQRLLQPASAGGQARDDATKIVVLLTDGIPNAYESDDDTIDNFAAANPGGEFYGGGYYWLDAALMKAMQLQSARVDMYPVGVGLGTDYDFMDRMARQGGTANSSGQSPRGSGNPAEYEQRMIEIFEKIIRTPVAKLVQ